MSTPATDAEWREHARGFHVFYRSTSCRHRLHKRCRHDCKWCPASCWCRCHGRFGLLKAAMRGGAVVACRIRGRK